MKELKWLGMATWLINGLSALNTGLKQFGVDMASWVYTSLPWLATPLAYVVGLSGLVGLLLFLKAVASGGSCCE